MLAGGDSAARFFLLLVVSGDKNWKGPEPTDEVDEGYTCTYPRNLLGEDARLERSATRASKLFGKTNSHETVVDKRLMEVPGKLVLLIDFCRAWRDAIFRKTPNRLAQKLLLLR